MVTIDGPAGAGKSTVARRLAERLGWRFLDTGAMYRAVALAALRAGVSTDDEQALERVVSGLTVSFPEGRVLLNGEDVSEAIRTPEVSAASSEAAACAGVRARLVEWQRRFAAQHDTVTEGRDQGTIVFPKATAKFYLTADAAVRAQRRQAELEGRGVAVSGADLLAQQQERDARDAARDVSPMRPAADAETVDTTGLAIDAVVELLLARVRERLGARSTHGGTLADA